MPAHRTAFALSLRVPLSLTLAAALACASTRSAGTEGTDGADASTATTARDCPPAGADRSTTVASPRAGARSPVIGAASRPALTAPGGPEAALREICAMMRHSAERWNAGDLDGFMADYMPGAGTTYIGRRGIVRGPEAIKAGYAPRFGPGGVHDSLSFENVEVDLLAPGLANTIAWYVLMRGDSLIARGPTSLVMRRSGGRWLIVHDHSS